MSQTKNNAVENGYWRQCCKTPLMDRKRSEEIRNQLGIERNYGRRNRKRTNNT